MTDEIFSGTVVVTLEVEEVGCEDMASVVASVVVIGDSEIMVHTMI